MTMYAFLHDVILCGIASASPLLAQKAALLRNLVAASVQLKVLRVMPCNAGRTAEVQGLSSAARMQEKTAAVSSVSVELACVQVHFINHFSGCQLCTEQNKNEDYKECETEFVKSFEYANSIMMKMLARKAARNVTMHAQLAALPYCKVSISLCLIMFLQSRSSWPSTSKAMCCCHVTCKHLHVRSNLLSTALYDSAYLIASMCSRVA